MIDLEFSSIERYKYFRDVHIWPLADDLNFEGWLKNFDNDNDLKIAYHILDFFTYYPKNMVDHMLNTSVGRAGYELSKYFSNWNHLDFKNWSCKLN